LPNLRFISVGENEGGEREREIRKSGDNTYLTTVEIWDLFNLLCPMRASFTSDSCKESQLDSLNPQSWLQVERGKLSKFSSRSSSSSSSM
jgi:hypothetical protein